MAQKSDLVVVGLGYVGLPLCQEAVAAGMTVVGLDANAEQVAALNAGRSSVDDVSDADIATMRAAGFAATTDPGCLDTAAAVSICVPTPLNAEDGNPGLRAVRAVAQTLAGHLHPGMLVVLESTTYPGTTEEIVRPLLEASGLVAGVDFHLA